MSDIAFFVDQAMRVKTLERTVDNLDVRDKELMSKIFLLAERVTQLEAAEAVRLVAKEKEAIERTRPVEVEHKPSRCHIVDCATCI